MKLIASLTSPFARKIRILLMEKAIPCELVVDIPWSADTRTPDYNPLGKVPVLLPDDGPPLYDSRVIAEYLDLVAGPAFFPADPRSRVEVRRLEALADGIADAAAAVFVERRRPEALISEEWIERQQQKIRAGLQALEADLGEKRYLAGDALTVADIAAVSALGYLDLRFPETAWRTGCAGLRDLYERLALRSSVRETHPPR